jgi:NADPH2:quinone reductase
VFDGIGEQGFSRAWAAVGPHGRLAAFGFSAGVQRHPSIVLLGFWFTKLWWWNVFSTARSAGFFSITSTRTKHPDWFVTDLGVLLAMLKRGEIKPRIAERISLDAVAEAHTRIEQGGLEGKVVLVPSG